MNQEEMLKNAYVARGAIEIFRIMQEDMFDQIAIATPPMSFPVDALYHGLDDIKKKIIKLNDSLASNVSEVELLKSSIKDLNLIIRDLSGEDDEGDFVWNMDFIGWERLQTKITIILEQAYQVIESLCRSLKPGIVKLN